MNAVLVPSVGVADRAAQTAQPQSAITVDAVLPRSSEISDTIRTILGAITGFCQEAQQAMAGQKTKRFPAGLGPTHGTDRLVVAGLLKNLSPIEEALTRTMADMSKGAIDAKGAGATIQRSSACLALLDDSSRRQVQAVLNQLC
jgi:hypothetical protein